MSGTLQGIEAEWIWHDGEFVPWHEARVHIMSLAVQFGSSVFEGIRCYATDDGPAIFRLPEHIRRLLDSCRVYRMDPGRSSDELVRACVETVARNGLEACYVRPMVLWGYGAAGMLPVGSPLETYIVTFPWGAYLGPEALEQGVDVCVSSWQRAEPNTYPAMVKSAGHYNNAQLMKMEAQANGYVEAIALTPGGTVSEGSGQNIFAVRGGVLHTPFIDGTSLCGITRDSVIQLAGDLGIPVRVEPMPREALYTADELFFTGTASEVTPIRSVDKIPVGAGRMGPVTRALQQRFLDAAHGRLPERREWLTPVHPAAGTASAATTGSRAR